jgi:hypothetical protein
MTFCYGCAARPLRLAQSSDKRYEIEPATARAQVVNLAKGSGACAQSGVDPGHRDDSGQTSWR